MQLRFETSAKFFLFHAILVFQVFKEAAKDDYEEYPPLFV